MSFAFLKNILESLQRSLFLQKEKKDGQRKKAADISVAFFMFKSFQKQPEDFLIRLQIPREETLD